MRPLLVRAPICGIYVQIECVGIGLSPMQAPFLTPGVFSLDCLFALDGIYRLFHRSHSVYVSRYWCASVDNRYLPLFLALSSPLPFRSYEARPYVASYSATTHFEIENVASICPQTYTPFIGNHALKVPQAVHHKCRLVASVDF